MIVVPFFEGQGLGNQLWVYAAGRAIAEQTNRTFKVEGTGHFKGASFISTEFEVGVEGRQSGNEAEDVKTYVEAMYYDEDLNYVAAAFDDLPTRISGSLRLEGLFQDERYLFGRRERVRGYFHIASNVLAGHACPDDVGVINLRGHEYKHHPRLVLPAAYWRKAVDNMHAMAGVSRFLVVTDDHAYASRLFPDLPIISGSVAACFATLCNARNLILSNSSFGYFPAALSRHRERVVIAPRHWARHGNMFRRWASPANLYQDWLWQDANGNLASFEDCLEERAATEQLYRTSRTVLCDKERLLTRGWRRLVTPKQRRLLKSILGRVLPAHVG